MDTNTYTKIVHLSISPDGSVVPLTDNDKDAEIARLRGLIEGLECSNISAIGFSCDTLARRDIAQDGRRSRTRPLCSVCRAKLAAQAVDKHD